MLHRRTLFQLAAGGLLLPPDLPDMKGESRAGGSITLGVGTAPVGSAPALPNIKVVRFFVRTRDAETPFAPVSEDIPDDALDMLTIHRDGCVDADGVIVADNPAAFLRLLDFLWASSMENAKDQLRSARGAINLCPGAGYRGGLHGSTALTSPRGERLRIASEGFLVGGQVVYGVEVWAALHAWIQDMDQEVA